MPAHWAPMPEDVAVTYVELPLPPGCSPATEAQTILPGPPPLDQSILKAMMFQVNMHIVSSRHFPLLMFTDEVCATRCEKALLWQCA